MKDSELFVEDAIGYWACKHEVFNRTDIKYVIRRPDMVLMWNDERERVKKYLAGLYLQRMEAHHDAEQRTMALLNMDAHHDAEQRTMALLNMDAGFSVSEGLDPVLLDEDCTKDITGGTTFLQTYWATFHGFIVQEDGERRQFASSSEKNALYFALSLRRWRRYVSLAA
eukprot:s1991_g8.t1